MQGSVMNNFDYHRPTYRYIEKQLLRKNKGEHPNRLFNQHIGTVQVQLLFLS